MSTAARTSRPTAGASAWFVFMVGSWLVFAVLAASSAAVLADLWEAVRDLPLVLEAIVWVIALPWMLALAVWESGWSETARVLVVLCIAAGWTLISIPRAKP